MQFTDLESTINYISQLKKPTLFFMVGLPYSGKSYISTLISKQLKIKRVSFDESWIKLSKYNNSLTWDIVIDNNLKICKHEIEVGNSIIYDTYSRDNNFRDQMKRFAKDSGAIFSTIYIQRNIDLIRKRHVENKVSNYRHSISDDSLEKEITLFVVPKLDSNSIRLII